MLQFENTSLDENQNVDYNKNEKEQKMHQKHQKRTKSQKPKSDFICEYCQKKFTRLYSLNKHLNGRCKKKGKKNDEILGYQHLIHQFLNSRLL